jgi:serine/threonine-protein kinase
VTSVTNTAPGKYDPRALAAAFDRFANFKLLGQGAEGAIFSVWDRFRKADLALKLMRDTGDPDLGERFEHEYQLLATSRSERLVRVFDQGTVLLSMPEGEVPHRWYTMEKCDGSVQKAFRTMPLESRVSVVLQLLDGLAFLHAKNISHRDIKPDNLFLVNGTQVKIGDFGLARPDQAAVDAEEHMIGEVLGSPPYLAPERWVGVQDADWRPSDQYAAGVTSYELLSAGRMPLDFGASLHDCFHAHLAGRVSPLRVPERPSRALPEVDAVLARMMGKRAEVRYDDMAECKGELSAALAVTGLQR